MKSIFLGQTPQNLIVADENTLKALIQDCLERAIRATKNEKPQPYTTGDVMGILCISKATLWRYQKEGKLHTITCGGKVLFDKAEVDALARGGKRGVK